MLYCTQCKKEIIIAGEGSSAGLDAEMDEWVEEAKRSGKILLYNPLKSKVYVCPKCGSQLVEK
jgi:DNA-directed RNA polymerase subunit RPC12/RpoP